MAAWVDLPTFRKFAGNDSSDDDGLLQAAIDLGCEQVEELCGPVITTTRTERVAGDTDKLVLTCRAVSITSIVTWPAGDAVDADAFYTAGQILARRDRGYVCGDLVVEYVTGSATAPAWAKAAACLIANQWFKGRLRPNLNDPTTLTGFLVPKQAMEIMSGHLLAAGGAS